LDFLHFDDLIKNFPDYTMNGLAVGAIYALVALGYTLVYGVLRLINFAHSEVFLVGTFAAMWAWTGMGFGRDSGAPGVGMALLLLLGGLVAAVIASTAMAVTVEFVAYRPLRKRNAPPLAFLISAIGASFVIFEAVGVFTERKPFGMPTVVAQKSLVKVGSLEITNIQLIVIFGALLMMFGLDQFVNRTRFGKGIRAVAQNPDAAALMGINKNRIIALVFLLGGIMAGVAALLYNVKFGFTKFNIGFLLGLKAFTAAVLGGIGNLRGALLGGFLIGLVENYASGLFGSNWRDFAAFVALIVLLMFRPTGLLGESLGRARA
jgi:branched-chain amino acid transport system permease protein